MIILESIVLGYFLYVVLYTLFFSVCSLFYKSSGIMAKFQYVKFCVFIPAYKEDAVIRETVHKTIDQAYPADSLHVVVIADGLKPETLAYLNKLPVQVIPVSFQNSTKVKSLQFALDVVGVEFDYSVILDADNVLHHDFLFKVNDLLQSKTIRAVQCQRRPKNKENNLAYLDGLSEAINNSIYRQGTTVANMSASISGSGVVIEHSLFKENIKTMNSVGGFDRELELRLLRRGAKVFYFKDAVVWDEKVSNNKAFQNQRRRWISSQYFYLRKYFKEGMLALLRGNFTFFNSAILRNVQLPRLINLGLLTLLVIIFFFLRPHLYFEYAWWPILLLCNLIAIAIAIPQKYYSRDMIKSFLSVPGLFFRMFLLLFRLKGANKNFIHTPHSIKHAHEGH